VANAVSDLRPAGHGEGLGRCGLRVGCGAEEVGGVVFWFDAEGEGVLVAGLFLRGDELAMGKPDERVEPEEGFDG